jgi:hypothetical protein
MACHGCDYEKACQKKITAGNNVMSAKEQDVVPMTCRCVVHDICRDCQRYVDRQCASWKILNGKVFTDGTLQTCPKKISKSGC